VASKAFFDPDLEQGVNTNIVVRRESATGASFRFPHKERPDMPGSLRITLVDQLHPGCARRNTSRCERRIWPL
jgi:hypothetical protein